MRNACGIIYKKINPQGYFFLRIFLTNFLLIFSKIQLLYIKYNIFKIAKNMYFLKNTNN